MVLPSFSIRSHLLTNDDAGLSGLVRKPGNLGVLLGHALPRVYHYKTHVGPVNSQFRSHDRKLLYPVVDLAAAAYARSIYKHIFAVLVLESSIHGVARSTRHVGDYDALLAQDEVYE